jgi:hypothetical protein
MRSGTMGFFQLKKKRRIFCVGALDYTLDEKFLQK